MNSCKEIADALSKKSYTDILVLQRKQSDRLFAICLVLGIALMITSIMFVSYIFYDRYMDGKASITATETKTVIQDSTGHNNYVDGEGDIINGSDSKEKDCKKAERK